MSPFAGAVTGAQGIYMRVHVAFAFSSVLSLSAVASAHVRLLEPLARYAPPANEDSTHLKDGPCGTTNDSRTTDAARITTFSPGQTITLRWEETVDHPGHYRIAFDDDGQDGLVDPTGFDDIQTNPTLPVLKDGIADGLSETQVTLPNITCSNCTLQLIQVMTDKPPWNSNDIYYQCADIKIEGELLPGGGTGGTGGVAGSSGMSGGMGGVTGGAPTAAGASAGGSPSASGSGGAPAATGGSSTSAGGGSGASGGASSSAGMATGSGGAGPDDDSSCALGGAPRSGGAGLMVLALGLSFLRRGRRLPTVHSATTE